MTRRSSIVALASAVAVSTSACQRAPAQYKGPYADKVADAVPKIEQAVGLKFKTPPKVEARSKEQVRSFLQKRFDEDVPAEEMAGSEAAYKRLGLLPDTLDLRRLMLDLLTEQIVGYFDPSTKVLYIVNGSPPDLVGVTVTHELVHALQDQYMNLDSLQHAKGDNDRQSAAQAVVEGQAVYEQLTVMLGGGNIAARLPGGWDRIRETIRESQGSMPIFASAPLIIQETLIFPYLSGAEFIRRYEEKDPGRVPYGAAMPSSTEQVLHAERYFGSRDEPTSVRLPTPTGATKVYENDFGEFETRVLLFEHLRDQAAAVRGAAGWDGDRYVLVNTPRGQGVVWLTVWDAATDAGEFYEMADRLVNARYQGLVRAAGGSGVSTYSGGGRSIRVSTGEVEGRPVVLYVDVPAGASTNLIDLGKVRLSK